MRRNNYLLTDRQTDGSCHTTPLSEIIIKGQTSFNVPTYHDLLPYRRYNTRLLRVIVLRIKKINNNNNSNNNNNNRQERAECPERTLSDVISTRRVSVCVSPAELTAPPIVFGFSFASHVQLS